MTPDQRRAAKKQRQRRREEQKRASALKKAPPPVARPSDVREAYRHYYSAEHVAASEILATSKPDNERVVEFAGNATGYASLMASEMSKKNGIACKAGCAYCCYIPVAVSPPEALLIAEAARRSLDATGMEKLRGELRSAAEKRAHPDVEVAAKNMRCAFLQDDDRCGIYAFRPIRCSGWTSFDKSICKESFERDEDLTQQICANTKNMSEAIADAVQAVALERGADCTSYELHSAVLRALDEEGAAGRWLAGERVFEGCTPALMPPSPLPPLSALRR